MVHDILRQRIGLSSCIESFHGTMKLDYKTEKYNNCRPVFK